MTARPLPPCPASPNCVSSLAPAGNRAFMPALFFEGTPQEAHDAVVAVLSALPRARIVIDEPDYVHAELTSRVFRFVDDVEFAIDAEARRIDFRSASREGYWDLGVNRRRMKRISRRLRKGAFLETS